MFYVYLIIHLLNWYICLKFNITVATVNTMAGLFARFTVHIFSF